MRIWVDADACPGQIKDLIVRAAVRRSVPVLFVANAQMNVPQSELIQFILVPSGPDVADEYIANNAEAGDLAITQDVPLASLLVPKRVIVISPRGESFNEANIADRLSARDLMSELRDLGTVSSSPRPFDDTMKRKFANLLDAAISKGLRK